MTSLLIHVTRGAAHAALGGLLLGACQPSLPGAGGAAPSARTPAQAWKPPKDNAGVPRDPSPEQPAPQEVSTQRALSLAQAIDLALRNSPSTRAAWSRARAASAQLGETRAAYYPRLDVGAAASYGRQTLGGGRVSATSGSVGPFATLTWLLLDFGRSARTDASLAALVAANYEHNAAIQDEMIRVADVYFRLAAAKALQTAARADVETAQANLAAIEGRKAAGRADLGDVLQARTALSRSRVTFQQTEGQLDILRGTMASSVGLDASAVIDTLDLPDRIDGSAAMGNVQAALDRALTSRPDLLAARAGAEAAWRRERAARQHIMPTLTFDANANRSYYLTEEDQAYGDSYGASLTLRFPLFAGFEDSYQAHRARADAEAAEADLESAERRVALEVWTSFHALRSSTEQLAESTELLRLAEQWEDVSRGRYDAGVGTVLDLMAAQTALASARATQIQARSQWFIDMLRLARDTGALERSELPALPSTSAPRPPAPRSGPPATSPEPSHVEQQQDEPPVP